MTEVVAGMWFISGLFVGMLALLEVGRRLRQRHEAQDESSGEGLGTIEGAVFALLGLLLAFTFSGAAARFDARRQLLVQETNAVSTAYLRVDLLQSNHQPALREAMRQYVDARLALYRAVPDSARMRAALARTAILQKEIWGDAVKGVREAPVPQVAVQLLVVLNEMFDLATTRQAATRMHPPAIIYGLLGVVSLVCALLAGYGMRPGEGHTWLHKLAMAATLAITIYVIIDLEYPRIGLLRVSGFDQLLVDLRAGMR
jgi:hypothetical protein